MRRHTAAELCHGPYELHNIKHSTDFTKPKICSKKRFWLAPLLLRYQIAIELPVLEILLMELHLIFGPAESLTWARFVCSNLYVGATYVKNIS